MPRTSYEHLANIISTYVQENLDKDIVLDDLAQHVGVSKYHLNRLFQATTGFQLGEFIQRRRLLQAYALLAGGEFSIIDVSLAVGYESHSAFSRAFLKVFGCKPGDVKSGEKSSRIAPGILKNISRRDIDLQPELVELPMQRFRGLYGEGFKENSFIEVAESLLVELQQRFNQADIHIFPARPIGVSLTSPWQGDQAASQFFLGFNSHDLPNSITLDDYLWSQGLWARFQHKGSYGTLWQTISRIYAGWVIPEGVGLKDDAIVQVYVNNPRVTAEADLITELYFPISV